MIRIAVIGYGYWGPNLSRVVTETEGAMLAGIVDRDPAARARAGKRYPGVPLLADAQEVLRDPQIDAVIIATPVDSHFTLARAALVAGKDVLLEKPMTSKPADAWRLVEEAEKRGRVLMVDHTFVYTPAVRRIGELIRSGDLGEVNYYDSTRINLGLLQPDVSVLWDLAVHDLAILDFILDEQPSAISAQGARHVRGRSETMAFLTLFYPSGAVAHVNVNWLAPVKVRRTLVGGTKKMIVYDDLEPSEKIKVYDKGVVLSDDAEARHAVRVGYRTGDMWAPQIANTEALRTEMDHFVACVRERSKPLTDGVVGAHVVETLALASRSIEEQGRPIERQPRRLAS